MKRYLLISVLLSMVLPGICQTPYDAFAKSESNREMLKLPAMSFKMENPDKTATVSYIMIDMDNRLLKYYNCDDQLINESGINPVSSKWTSMDPLAEKYYSVSPYAFCLNNPVRYVDPDGMDVYILFYTFGNRGGDNAFEAAAMTRKKEIESGKNFNSETDKVIVIGIMDISDVGTGSEWVVDNFSEKYGQTAEVGVWSHGAMNDGPIGSSTTSKYQAKKDDTQMSVEGWGSFNFNWKSDANLGFYGCNTANENAEKGAFAKRVSEQSNMSGVTVWGQPSSSYPSTSPFHRSTNFNRTTGFFHDGLPTYMISGDRKKGAQAHIPGLFPKAKPMNGYQNGRKR